MSKKALLLFAKSSVEKGLADPAALIELLTAANKGLTAAWAYFDELVYSLNNEEVGLYDSRNDCQVSDYDIVYFRYWGAQEGHAISAARICKLLGVPFIDEEVLRRGSQNKITQYANLYELKVPIPRTLIAPGELLRKTYASYGFDFPFIMKDKGGTRGEGNYLVHNSDQMAEVVAAHPEVTFILQEFIPNNGDYRVLVVGREVRLVIQRRAAKDTHLNNTSKGGAAELVPNDTLPTEVLEDCVRAAQFYGRDVAGVDIVRSEADGNYYCFEVNRAPQIEHASFEREKAEILAEYLASL